jgi:biopolymer transport protein ExbD
MAMGSMGGDKKKGSTTAEPYINVTPLIDVLLVLLIIFMVVTPLKPSRFQADIPTQRDPNEDLSKLKPNPLTLVVSIGSDLSLKLNADSVGSVNDVAPLAQRLALVFAQRKEQRDRCAMVKSSKSLTRSRAPAQIRSVCKWTICLSN